MNAQSQETRLDKWLLRASLVAMVGAATCLVAVGFALFAVR